MELRIRPLIIKKCKTKRELERILGYITYLTTGKVTVQLSSHLLLIFESFSNLSDYKIRYEIFNGEILLK